MLNTTHTSCKDIASQWLAAFNEQELEKLLSLYHDDAVHYSPKLRTQKPETNGLIQGKAALWDWWKPAFERLQPLHYELKFLTANNERVFMEYTRTVLEEEPLQVAEVLDIEHGLIVASRVYHG